MSTFWISVLGRDNGLGDWLGVLALYGMMFLFIRHGYRRLELNFQRSYRLLYFGYACIAFGSNYLAHLAGAMSFLPWLNNTFHCFLWLGFCLTYLYAGIRDRGFWEQFALFTVASFFVKVGEHLLLGTWEMDHFFVIPGQVSYMLGWSVVDGFLPVISRLGLKFLGKYMEGVIP